MFKTVIKTVLLCYLLQNQLIQADILTEDQIREMTAMLHKHCKAESGVAEEIIDASRSGQLSSDPNFKCYIACTLEFIGVMDSDGNISYDHVYDLLPTETKEIVDTITSKCSGIFGVDNCDTAWKTAKCYFEADLSNMMMFTEHLAK